METTNVLNFKIPEKENEMEFGDHFLVLETFGPEISGCPNVEDAHESSRALYYEALQQAIECLQFSPETYAIQCKREKNLVALVAHVADTFPQNTQKDISNFYSFLLDIMG